VASAQTGCDGAGHVSQEVHRAREPGMRQEPRHGWKGTPLRSSFSFSCPSCQSRVTLEIEATRPPLSQGQGDDASGTEAVGEGGDVAHDVVSASKGKPCAVGCLCARHDPTPFTGNPNWAEEYNQRKLMRRRAEQNNAHASSNEPSQLLLPKLASTLTVIVRRASH
jgi:hypothetical protein